MTKQEMIENLKWFQMEKKLDQDIEVLDKEIEETKLFNNNPANEMLKMMLISLRTLGKAQNLHLLN